MADMIYIIFFILGTIIGSFLNAWMWRTRSGGSILKGRSECRHCKKMIAFFDNIPVLSFLLLKGKCRGCKKKISWQYPLVEIASGIIFAFVAYMHFANMQEHFTLIRDLSITSLLIFIFVYDFLYKEIWDRVTTIPALILIPFILLLGWQTWQSLALGIVIGAGFFLMQYVISKGRWIGGGDIRLGFFMGVVLGFPTIILALLFAYVVGAFWSLFLVLLKKKSMKSETAFGTYLVLGTFVAMIWGERIVGWYMNFLG